MEKEVSLLFIKVAPDIDHESLMMSWGVSQSNVLKCITLFPAHWTVKLKLSHHYLLLMITKWRTCQIKVGNTSLSVRFEWKKIVKPFQLSNSVTDEEIRYALKILVRQAVDWVVLLIFYNECVTRCSSFWTIKICQICLFVMVNNYDKEKGLENVAVLL